MSSRGRVEVSLTVLLLTMYGCSEKACIFPPCAPPLALEVTVTSAATGAPVAGVSLRQTHASAQELPCPDSKCILFGSPGSYEFDISAPGYQTTRRTVVVTGSIPECGCPRVDTQHVTVALPVAG